MKIRKTPGAAVLSVWMAWAPSPARSAGTSAVPDLQLLALSGKIEIQSAGHRRTFVPGDERLADIPSGAVITVHDGGALLAGPGISIKMGAGTALRYDYAWLERVTRSLKIEVLSGSEKVLVDIGRYRTTLPASVVMSVDMVGPTVTRLRVLQGELTLRIPDWGTKRVDKDSPVGLLTTDSDQTVAQLLAPEKAPR